MKKSISNVKFMIGDSDEEDETPPGTSTTSPQPISSYNLQSPQFNQPSISISISEPSSPHMKPESILIHSNSKNGSHSRSFPRLDSGSLSPLNPNRIDKEKEKCIVNVDEIDGFPFPDMNDKENTIKKENDVKIEIEGDEYMDPTKKEAMRIVREFSKKKAKGDKSGNVTPTKNYKKSSVLSNILSLHQYNTKSPVKVKESDKQSNTPPKDLLSPKFHPNEKLRNSLDESKNSRMSFIKNSSYRSLTDFFGLPSPRSSISLTDTLSHTPMKKVAAAIEAILKRQTFIQDLCKAFILYGAPSHRLESNMHKVAEVLDVDASFASLPGLMLISFRDKDLHTSETVLLRVSPGYDMYRLEKVVNIYHRICKEDLHLVDAAAELSCILEDKPLYPPWAELLNYGLGSFAVAPMIFKGNFFDAFISGLLGLLVGLMMLLARRFEGYSNVFEVTAAILSAFIATALHNYVCYWAVVLSATVNLLPGLSLTVAVVELASKNMVSGAVRMFYALIMAFVLGFGLSLGVRLYASIDSSAIPENLSCTAVSPYWNFLLFPLAITSFNIFLNSHPKQWIYMSSISLLGYLISYFAPRVINSPDVIPAVASLGIGIASNLLARFTGTIPIIPLLSGVLLLVPGSLGVKGSAAFLVEKSSEGASFALQMIIIALSITVGLFLSTFVVYPMGSKRSTLMTF